ncbi:UDP-glycosyltransferase UGT5-like [Episyrphus balteatus]|uniref:UDP-glycosyltransferase UGT5-like n=1 Tax=Episyrphus balteatus TaxID=286459 RepID=UPI0024855205|nr:UDP-glycosyltransferase UGT5-like [Episyrphus balteatus]
MLVPETEERKQIVAKQNQVMKDSKIETTWQFVKYALPGMINFGGCQLDTLKSPQFQELMNNHDNKFDLILLGSFFADYLLGLGEHFNCPVILSLPQRSNEYYDRHVGNPPEIAYRPTIVTMSQRNHTTLMGRFEYFWSQILWKYLMYQMDQTNLKIYNEMFPAPKYPPLEKAAKRVSLLLANHHLSEGHIRPDVPAVIYTGGIQIKDPSDPLPKDLQDIIDSSKHGVIFLSFGSNLGSKQLGEEMVQKLYNAMANLKQTVLWKWDDTPKPGNAPNIHFTKWIPQDDLLAQPQVKLFITHAGKGGIAEAQYHGVPMVAVPMFIDQPGNAKKMVEDGFGVEVDKNTMTAESFRAAVLEVLENPKYTENVQKFSKLYRDRPMTARETAVFWIEYVLRHKGAYHMQSPAIELNTFQYYMLDVIGIIFAVAFLVLISITNVEGLMFFQCIFSCLPLIPALDCPAL